MTLTPLQFSNAFRAMARTIEAERKATLARTALTAKKAVIAERNRVTGSDGRLSGARNALLGVKYTVGDTDVLVRATGPWQLVEYDTRSAGVIVGKTRSAKTGRYRRTLSRGKSEKTKLKRYLQRLSYTTGTASFANVRPLATPWGPKSKIIDKGTKGQKPFQKGLDRAEPLVMKELTSSVTSAVREAFGR